MSGEHFYGQMTTCRECGGPAVPSGNTRHGRSRKPLINCDVARSVWIVEYTCKLCGHDEWFEDELVDAPL